MLAFIAKRLGLLIPTVFGVVTLVFFFVHMIPGDPVEVMLGETAQSADKELLRRQLGLDKPLHRQYLDFLGGVAAGDMGESFFYHEGVVEVIAARLPATIRLAVAAMFFSLLIGLPAGIIAAVKRNSAFDGTAMAASLLGVAMPNFWLGPLLIIGFSLKLEWFPVSGDEGFASLVLPALTLGASLAAILSRMTRSSVLEALSEDYVLTARAKGLPERTVVLKHVLRNALMPIITIVGLQVGALLSGAIVTETIFAWPGIGSLLIDAIRSRDYPLVQGCVLVISASYVFVNLAADLAYGLVDPRVRLEGRPS